MDALKTVGQALAALFLFLPPAQTAELWFTPNPRSADYLDLFTKPDDWVRARAEAEGILPSQRPPPRTPTLPPQAIREAAGWLDWRKR